MEVREFRNNRAVIEIDLAEATILEKAIGNDGEALQEWPLVVMEMHAVLETAMIALRDINTEADA